MSDKDNYPDGAYNDPNAPWNEPEPIEYTDAFHDKKDEIFQERIEDTYGTQQESITEANVKEREALTTAIKARDVVFIGTLILDMVDKYCTPSYYDVITELEGQEL